MGKKMKITIGVIVAILLISFFIFEKVKEYLLINSVKSKNSGVVYIQSGDAFLIIFLAIFCVLAMASLSMFTVYFVTQNAGQKTEYNIVDSQNISFGGNVIGRVDRNELEDFKRKQIEE